jgi:hypothetical protein
VSLTQSYAGRSRFNSDQILERHLLLVSVPCIVSNHPLDALLDTGSQWCILPASIAAELGFDSQSDSLEAMLSTRFGTLQGRLVRNPVRFPAHVGEAIEVDTTWFVSEDWPGPAVIGWKGCLERIRFALDPTDDSFYFGDL